MCPSIVASSTRTATPRPLTWSPSSSPSQLNDGRVAVAFDGPAVHPATDGDETELAGTLIGKLDEARFDEVDGVAVPRFHLHDPPPTGQGRHWSSPLLS